MKRSIIIFLLLLPLALLACNDSGGGGSRVLTFFSTDTPRMIPDEDFIQSDILVTRGPSFISQVEVTVAIVHPEVSDLELVLVSPENTVVFLADNDSDGEDFWYTTFTEDAIVGIWEATLFDSPRTGFYLPVDSLDLFFGEDAIGLWTLDVEDNVALDDGYLIEWSIDIR